MNKKRKDILNQEVMETVGIIKHGWLNEKVLREIRMTTSLYDHIQVVDKYYNGDITVPIWEDVEGMGYGWEWMRHEEEVWYKMMCKIIDVTCKAYNHYVNNVYYIVSDYNEVKEYNLILITEDKYRGDTVISLSNKELYY